MRTLAGSDLAVAWFPPMLTTRPFLSHASTAARLLVLLALLLALAGCGPKLEREAVVDPQLRSQALIDSGNASYKRADFASAATRYASAASVKPDDPAAYYGLGMALAKLGRDDDARIAYAKAREIVQRSGSRDTLPAGHPTTGR